MKVNDLRRITTVELAVEPTAKQQTIDGFGVNINPKYWEKGGLVPVMELLLEDLGAVLYRLDVFGKSNWVDVEGISDKSALNEETYRRIYTGPEFRDAWSMARYLNDKGIKPYLNASGVVPAWMCAADGATLTDYEAFADMMSSMLHWARHEEKIDFELFGPLNETDIGPPEGPIVSAQEFTKAMEVMIDALDRRGLSDVHLVVAEQAYFNTNYVVPLLQSKKLLGRIAVIGMHKYSDFPVAEIPELLKEYEDGSTRFWMTEYGDLDETGAAEWEVAWRSTDRLLECLNDGAQAGLVWDAYDNYHDHDEAWTLYGLIRRGRHEYTPKKRYYAAKQIYRFVRPGSRKIGLTGWSERCKAVAFERPDNGLTIVGMNCTDETIRIELRLPDSESVPGSVYQAYFTNEELDCEQVGVFAAQKGLLHALIPKHTIFTFDTNQ